MADDIRRNEQGEIVVLGHSPWPGYRKIFYVVFALGNLYLLLAFSGLFSSGGH
jgi:hypothetical protein